MFAGLFLRQLKTRRRAISNENVKKNMEGGGAPGRVDSESRFAIFLARILWKIRLTQRK